MRILAVDIGTSNVGLAVLNFEEKDSSKVALSRYLQIEKDEFSNKLCFLYSYFLELISEYGVTDISYEAPFFGNSRNGNELVMVGGILTLLAGQSSIPVKGYTASSVKKMVTGSGKADKKQVEDAIRTYFSFDSSYKFEAGRHSSDAIAIGLTYYLKEFSNKEP
jgi:crossover junction endodeoxyribonuclease RuvC